MSYTEASYRLTEPKQYVEPPREDVAEAANQPFAAAIVEEIAPDERSAAESTLGIVELLLKRPQVTDVLARDGALQTDFMVRCLAIGVAGFATFGVAMTVVLNIAAEAPAGVPAASWSDRTAGNLILAYVFGLIAANGVCLPSFYFYSLLAGIRTSMRGLAAQAMKSMAAGALATIGLLPIYFAIVLGLLVFGAGGEVLNFWIYAGLLLPFVAGLWGVRSLYLGICGLADTMDPTRRAHRQCFLQRLVLCWCTCYTAVAPLMIYWLWFNISS